MKIKILILLSALFLTRFVTADYTENAVRRILLEKMPQFELVNFSITNTNIVATTAPKSSLHVKGEIKALEPLYQELNYFHFVKDWHEGYQPVIFYEKFINENDTLDFIAVVDSVNRGSAFINRQSPSYSLSNITVTNKQGVSIDINPDTLVTQQYLSSPPYAQGNKIRYLVIDDPDASENFAKLVASFKLDIEKFNTQMAEAQASIAKLESELEAIKLEQQNYWKNINIFGQEIQSKEDLLKVFDNEINQFKRLNNPYDKIAKYDLEIFKAHEKSMSSHHENETIEALELERTKTIQNIWQEYHDRLTLITQSLVDLVERYEIEYAFLDTHIQHIEQKIKIEKLTINDITKQNNIYEQELNEFLLHMKTRGLSIE
ncbi:hypothetical protein [Thorsellia anophelis]|uniref:Uncharacterized protein n=1 Tax=Thorsellia anophelis DSM 18579 TaxID=1123402 RepID=A0A1I0E8J7_9GAMM|nr:hypothetical protein [Thorsellia anophelis]SET41387.1 hypothetical protein SAMN02583745_02285 [Thorsellia anophelis DSM 18579]